MGDLCSLCGIDSNLVEVDTMELVFLTLLQKNIKI